ncbi:MAG: hypothetical protein WKF37_06855 [Bryobacteraceae bacterium]
MNLGSWICLTGLLAGVALPVAEAAEKKLLYVATPGIRNYVEYGGVGILVFDRDNGHRLVKRIPTLEVAPGQMPENVKGIAANARTARIYLSTPKRIAGFDLVTEKKVWEKEVEGGADRMALSPNGEVLYVPSFEGPHWNVLNAATGAVITKIETNSGAHNTIYGPDGRRAYLAGLKSPLLSVANTNNHQVIKTVGPFGHSIRPFTVNGRGTLCFVNVNGLLGFEVGDIKTGKMLHRVEVEGYKQGSVKRHGCPSHGIGLTPDEKELWVVDGHNNSVHIFDATSMPPKQMRPAGSRSTGVDNLQHRRQIRLPVDR